MPIGAGRTATFTLAAVRQSGQNTCLFPVGINLFPHPSLMQVRSFVLTFLGISSSGILMGGGLRIGLIIHWVQVVCPKVHGVNGIPH